MKLTSLVIFAILLLVVGSTPIAIAKGDDFGSIVKLIEKFYSVKHQGIPFLAKAGIKTATTVARIKGGTARRIAEAGSVKVAVFENQQFEMKADFTAFRKTLNQSLKDAWMPLIQTLSATNKEQCYIFLQEAGAKFNVLVITIEPNDATVVQVTVSPKNLVLLMKDPDGMGKAITDEATIVDQE